MVDVSSNRPSPGSGEKSDTLIVPEPLRPDLREVLYGIPAGSQTVRVKTAVFPLLDPSLRMSLHVAVKVLIPIPVSMEGDIRLGYDMSMSLPKLA